MKTRTVFVPRAPKGTSAVVSFPPGKKGYRVSTAVTADGHTHSMFVPDGMLPAEAAKRWRQVERECGLCCSRKHPEERHKPTTEPFLAEWLALHKQHLKALRHGKKNPIRLADAAKLADAKYAVYRRERDALCPMLATARGMAKALRKQGVKANARKGVVRVTAKGKK